MKNPEWDHGSPRHQHNHNNALIKEEDEESVNSAAELEKSRLIHARAINPDADLFAEGEAPTIVLKPRVIKPKSKDPEAYLSLDIWSLAKSGNVDALKGLSRPLLCYIALSEATADRPLLQILSGTRTMALRYP
jgi:hypothetical protein